MKKGFLRALGTVLTLAGLVSGAAAEGWFGRDRSWTPGMFADVDEGAWYASAVKEAYELGLMNGAGDGTFSPEGVFTLSQAMAVAGRMYDLYYGGRGVLPSYRDNWEEDAFNYCLDNGIIRSGLYEDYTRGATRAEAAAILAGALPEEAWNAVNSVTELPDVGDATDNREAIFKLYNAGVLTGCDDFGSFRPDDVITRMEAAAIAARCADPALRRELDLILISN